MSFETFSCITSVGMAIVCGAISVAYSKLKGKTWEKSLEGTGCLMVVVALFCAFVLAVYNACWTVYEIAQDHDDYHYGIWQGDEGRRREREDRRRREQREREEAESEAADAAGMAFSTAGDIGLHALGDELRHPWRVTVTAFALLHAQGTPVLSKALSGLPTRTSRPWGCPGAAAHPREICVGLPGSAAGEMA